MSRQMPMAIAPDGVVIQLIHAKKTHTSTCKKCYVREHCTNVDKITEKQLAAQVKLAKTLGHSCTEYGFWAYWRKVDE